MSEFTDDPIERLLREDARRPLPDDGFGARVALALPAPAGMRSWLRTALVAASAAVGGVAAWALAPTGTSLLQGFADLTRLQSQTPSALGALAVAVAMAVTAAVLVAEEN